MMLVLRPFWSRRSGLLFGPRRRLSVRGVTADGCRRRPKRSILRTAIMERFRVSPESYTLS